MAVPMGFQTAAGRYRPAPPPLQTSEKDASPVAAASTGFGSIQFMPPQASPSARRLSGTALPGQVHEAATARAGSLGTIPFRAPHQSPSARALTRQDSGNSPVPVAFGQVHWSAAISSPSARRLSGEGRVVSPPASVVFTKMQYMPPVKSPSARKCSGEMAQFAQVGTVQGPKCLGIPIPSIFSKGRGSAASV